MSRSQQDQFIDDEEEETCPLCIEAFDLSDRNFRPCPCGYQICQFCYNNIKTTMNGLCPACRRPYDEKNIEWKVISPEEMANYKAEIAQKAKKSAQIRQKEAQKREADSLSRKHLAGLRVVQKNLVYVTGLAPTVQHDRLLETLRGDQYFGQYGKIVKIVVSKAKDTSHPQQSVGVYVTYARKEDAATCIAAVDGSQNGDRILRAQYGTTKYCSAYLRGETCGNRNCMFLHEPGDDSESFTRQDLSSMNVISTQQPAQSQRSQPPPQHAPQPIASAASQMDRQDSNEGGSTHGNDRPALPSTASWANKPPTRRLSQATASSGASPATRPAKVEPPPPEPQQPLGGKGKQKSTEASSATSTPQPKTPEQAPTPAPAPASSRKPKSATSDLDNVLKTVATSDFSFRFCASHLSEEDQKIIALMPPLFDPNGGAKRRAMKERERQQQEAEAQALLQAAAPAAETDETTEGGSLQLGGEPEERQDAPLGRGQHSAIAPPSQQNLAAGLGLGQNFGLGESFVNLGLDGRGLTSQQQQALLQRIKTDPQAANLLNAFQGGQQSQQGLGHGPVNTAPAHARQTSRYSFANDSGTATTNVKPVPNPNLMKQQSTMLPQNNNFNQTGQHQSLGGNQFYGSNVHGPPPGLKTTGTPPVSGGGMFGQGHGFTTSGGLGYGAAGAGRNANEEMMRDLLRSRGGNAGGNQISEAAKRELLFPYNQSHSSASTPAPAPGLISLPFGPQSYQDSASQKQKKKGKKHRHANTSSSGGGGIVDVADPSILQARLHQGGAAMVGQGVYSGQGQGGSETAMGHPLTQHLGSSSSTVASVSHSVHVHQGILETPRRSTPTIPPGFSGHPAADPIGDAKQSSDIRTPNTPIVPALPLLPPGFTRTMTPKRELQDSSAPNTGSTARDDSNEPAAKTAVVPEVSKNSPHEDVDKGKKAELDNPAHRGSPVRSKAAKGQPLSKTSTAEVSKPSASAIRTSTEMAPSTSRMSHAVGASSERDAEEEKPLSSKRQPPGKLDIIAATSMPESTEQTHGSRARASSKAAIPSTPTAAVSKGSPIKKTASKILRVIQTPKTETPPPMSASSISSVPVALPQPGRQASRQPSVASINLPGTPANELTSDNASVTSASLSRASSPPPGGKAAPSSRAKAKSLGKKERQEKAKQLTEDRTVTEETAKQLAEETIQEPILGRKKKARKASKPVPPLATTSAASKAEKAQTKEQPIKAEPSPVAESPSEFIESAKPQAPAPEVESPVTAEEPPRRHFPTAASIISDLQASGDIIASTLEFFKPISSLAHRSDITAEDLANLERRVPYSKKDLENIAKHIPVHLGGDDDVRPSERALVMPEGVLWNLTKDLEQRYLELSERVKEVKSGARYHHRDKRQTKRSASVLPSFTDNVDNAHAKATAKAIGPALPAGATGTLSPMDDPIKFLNQFVLPTESSVGSVMRGGEPVGMTKIGPPIPGVPSVPSGWLNDIGEAGRLAADLLEGYIVQGESVLPGRTSVEEIERDLLESRKQVERLEKQLNTLVKKNRKLLGGH